MGKAASPWRRQRWAVLRSAVATRGRPHCRSGRGASTSLLRVVKWRPPEPGRTRWPRQSAGAAARRRSVRLGGGLLSRNHQSGRCPRAGITRAELTSIYTRCWLRSGYTAMNRIRKRFSRWGGQAGAGARSRTGAGLCRFGRHRRRPGLDRVGPCVPTASAADVRACSNCRSLVQDPESARPAVASTASGKTPETPKPGDEAFARVTLELVASNRLALEAAAKRAAELGLAPRVVETPLAGEASTAGASVAASLLNNCVRQSIPQPSRSPSCLIWGGETTVTLGENPTGLGGRSQELALAAARALERRPEWMLLAAGTDCRDGPTTRRAPSSMAGTWTRIKSRGVRDPLTTSPRTTLSGARFGGRASQAGTHRRT